LKYALLSTRVLDRLQRIPHVPNTPVLEHMVDVQVETSIPGTR
jgi:hypothetical protein